MSDSDTADVDAINPAVDIQKTPDLQTLLAGEDAVFSITVTNIGDTELTNVVVTDPLAAGCETTFAALAIGGAAYGVLKSRFGKTKMKKASEQMMGRKRLPIPWPTTSSMRSSKPVIKTSSMD